MLQLILRISGVMMLLAGFLGAQESQSPLWYHYADDTHIAIDGYDVVAYHIENAARKGLPAHVVDYDGLRFQFLDKANAEKFADNPEKYLPGFGGWCAFGFTLDLEQTGFAPERYAADPRSFKIINGRLYLFYNDHGFDAKAAWEHGDESALIEKAEAFWKNFQGKADDFQCPAGMNRKAPLETAQLNFLIGEWDCIQKVKLADGSFRDQTALWKAYYSLNGFAIQDEWYGSGGYQGSTWRSYDPNSQQWVMTYMQANSSTHWLMRGQFRDGEFHAEFNGETPAGQTFRQRIRFYNIAEDRFSWAADRTFDEGKTWIEDVMLIEAKRRN